MKNKRVIWEAGIDNHHEIVEKYEIPDNEEDQQEMLFARVEILPPDNENGVFDKNIDNWVLMVDERIKPEWFSPAHKQAAIWALKECLNLVIIDGVTVDKIKNKRGLFVRNSTIEMLGNSTVQKMFDSSTVQEMWGNSTVQKMLGNSTVNVYSEKATVGKILSKMAVAVCRLAG
jgi:hypothetical protein